MDTSKIEKLDREVEQLTAFLSELEIAKERINQQQRETKQTINSLIIERERRLTEKAAKRDRHGEQIEVGDYVNFLTKGRFKSKSGKVTKINHVRFITAVDDEGRKINREPQNVEIYRRANANNDIRRKRK